MNVEEIDKEIEQIKRAMLDLGLKKERLLHEQKLFHFIPTPKQLLFFEQSNIARRGGFCGNRFGKSTLGVVEDCCWLIGERPFFAEGHPLRRAGIPTHGVKGLVIAEDWEKVREIFTEDRNTDEPGKFFDFLPEHLIKHRTRNQQSIIESITVESMLDGRRRTSTVRFDTVSSFKSNPKSMESSDWDFIHIDEPLPELMWKAISRGLIDRNGYSWWLMTCLTEPWMYNTMIEESCRDPKNFWMFEATMDDNPTLTEDAKRLYLSQLSVEELECRRSGKPLAHSRLVLHAFKSDKHIWSKQIPPHGWKNFYQPPPSYLCAYAIDPHPMTPHAVLFVAISPFGDVFVYDEIFEKCMISKLAVKIKKRLERARFGYGLCDPSAWVENPDTGRRWVDTLYSQGLYVQRGSKDLGPGIIQTNDLLGSARNVWVFPHCRNFIREVKTWYFDKENKPADKDDHMMENFRRLVQHEQLRYHAPTELDADMEPVDQFSAVDFNISGFEMTGKSL